PSAVDLAEAKLRGPPVAALPSDAAGQVANAVADRTRRPAPLRRPVIIHGDGQAADTPQPLLQVRGGGGIGLAVIAVAERAHEGVASVDHRPERALQDEEQGDAEDGEAGKHDEDDVTCP